MLREILIRDEGISLTRYKCTAGKDTIGVGRNLEDRGLSKDEIEEIGDPYPYKITYLQAMMLLDNDIKRFSLEVFKALPWLQQEPQVIQDVLISMAFNMGVSGLLKFKLTLKAIKEHRYEEAAEAMLNSRWATQVGARATRLAKMVRETV